MFLFRKLFFCQGGVDVCFFFLPWGNDFFYFFSRGNVFFAMGKRFSFSAVLFREKKICQGGGKLFFAKGKCFFLPWGNVFFVVLFQKPFFCWGTFFFCRGAGRTFFGRGETFFLPEVVAQTISLLIFKWQ